MFKATIAGLVAHKLRLALTAFAIILGVSFVVATLTLANSIQSAFDKIVTDQTTGTAVVVHGHYDPAGENGGFNDPHYMEPDSLVQTIESVSGVQGAEGEIFRPGAVPVDPATGKPFPSRGPPQFATNWLTDSSISPFHLRQGHPPTSPGDVVIDAATARAHHIQVGQTLSYIFNNGPQQQFVVTGITGFGNSDTSEGATISLFTLPTTRSVLGLPDDGTVDQIFVSAQGGVTQTDLRDRIAKVLPSSAEATTEADWQGQQLGNIDSVFSIIRNVLLAFALIALFVGAYIIFNTFNILIAQRTRELALLRALGASRAQVFRLVLLESTLVGLLGSAIGCGVGLLLAHALYSALNSSGGGLPPATIALQGSTVLIAMILGTLVTVVAAVMPARRASGVAPVEAIREASDAAVPVGRARIISGVVVTLLGAVLIWIGLFAGFSWGIDAFAGGAFVVVLGVSMLAPLAVLPIAGTLGIPIEQARGVPGKLARLNAIRAPRRAAATAAALMIGASLVVGIAVIGQSIKTSQSIAINESVRADFIVTGSENGGRGTIDPTVAQALAHDPSFTSVEPVYTGRVLVNGQTTTSTVVALDPTQYAKVFNIDVASGNPTDLAESGSVFVDASVAATHNWHVGDAIAVDFPEAQKRVPLRIACVYNANPLLQQAYVISSSDYQQYFKQKNATLILLNASSHTPHESGLIRLTTDLRAFPTLKGFDKKAFIALESTSVDQLTNILNLFLVMAIFIASLGIVNTMALSIIERTREIGLLRAVGLERRQTRTMVRWESVLLALLGLVLGMILGVALGAATVKAFASVGIGHIDIPWGSLVVYVFVAILIGLIAGILPARRASRLNILAAIATE